MSWVKELSLGDLIYSEKKIILSRSGEEISIDKNQALFILNVFIVQERIAAQVLVDNTNVRFAWNITDFEKTFKLAQKLSSTLN